MLLVLLVLLGFAGIAGIAGIAGAAGAGTWVVVLFVKQYVRMFDLIYLRFDG